MKVVEVWYSQDYGRDAFYPDNPLAEGLAWGLNRKTFSARTLREIAKKYEVRIVGAMFEIPDEFKKYDCRGKAREKVRK